ncbi:unnamed protein product [Lactuca virosa]|uniref:Uncharacterized protein n=1 Tax=Lactuca virosa TaxID=75947 RepID=A0AAU9MD28_9ASTR|nr:unnamed protein product [Lactuca virosa]
MNFNGKNRFQYIANGEVEEGDVIGRGLGIVESILHQVYLDYFATDLNASEVSEMDLRKHGCLLDFIRFLY